MKARLARALVALALGVVSGFAAAQEPAVEFPAARTVLWAGRSQVVAFELEQPASEDIELATSSDAPERVEVLRPGRVAAGETLGYARVRAHAPGEALLQVGGAGLLVTVREAPASAPVNQLGVRLVGVAEGAVVWGTVALGVEVDPGLTATDVDVWIELSDGSTLEGARAVRVDRGPLDRRVFDWDTGGCAPGTTSLRAVASTADGDFVESQPLSVRVADVASDRVATFECEDYLDSERPVPYGEDDPFGGSSPGASGGRYAFLERADPGWLMPLDVAESGLYQAVVTGRGEFGVGAFPSVGLCIDDPYSPTRSVALVDARWHRLPLGPPLRLEAGEHVVSLRFLNDAWIQNTSNRNLHLDRLELVRVEPAGSSAGGDGMGGGAMMGAGTSSASAVMARYGGSSAGLAIALERPIDDLPVNGRLALRAYCRIPGADRPLAPTVELLVNGESRGTQQALQPLFPIDRASLEPGPNRIQLVATLPDGRRASTPVQTVHRVGPEPDRAPREYLRFGVLGDRWDAAIAELWTGEGEEAGHYNARFEPGDRSVVRLPDDLTGRYDVVLESRGPEDSRVVVADVALLTEEGEAEVGRERVQNWWSYRELGTVELTGGEQSLALACLAADGSTDRAGDGMHVRSVFLRSAAGEDRSPPSARILYPEPGQELHELDAIVCEAVDDLRVEWADIELDGRAMRSFGAPREGVGHLVLPLILRDVEPGPHTLRVRVADERGNVGESQEIEVVVRGEAPERPGRYARAVHLLNRFAFGPEPDELARVLVHGETAWLRRALGEPGAGEAAALGAANVILADYGTYYVTRATSAHLLRTDNPARARLVQWIENHFSTWMQKAQPGPEWREHRTFLELGPGPFGELLLASATSPAMLVYLDQRDSYAGQLNENFAREILELHSVGVDGGYDQDDVRSLAILLAGLTVADEAFASGQGALLQRRFRYDPDLGSSEPRTVLGMRFDASRAGERFDRFRLAVEMLAAHPSTAEFVSRKLAEHYVAVPAPDALVDDLALVYHESGGDLREVLLAIAAHPAFWDDVEPRRMTSPMDYGVRLARTCDGFNVDWKIQQFLDLSGMGFYDRATPDGYPEGDGVWIDTNAMLQRWSLPGDVPWLVTRLVPDPLKARAGGDVEAWRQRCVDAAAVRITGHLLGDESNAAALEFLASARGEDWQRVQDTAIFVCRTPEASLE